MPSVYDAMAAAARQPAAEDTGGEAPEADTSIADYVWLPIRFDGKLPVIDWYDEWRIEDHA